MLTCLYATSPNAAIPGSHQFSQIGLGWRKGQWTDCGAVRTTENEKTNSGGQKLFQPPLECHGPWIKLWFPKSLYFDRLPRRISLPASKWCCFSFSLGPVQGQRHAASHRPRPSVWFAKWLSWPNPAVLVDHAGVVLRSRLQDWTYQTIQTFLGCRQIAWQLVLPKNIRENPMTCRSLMSSLDDLTWRFTYKIFKLPVASAFVTCFDWRVLKKPWHASRRLSRLPRESPDQIKSKCFLRLKEPRANEPDCRAVRTWRFRAAKQNITTWLMSFVTTLYRGFAIGWPLHGWLKWFLKASLREGQKPRPFNGIQSFVRPGPRAACSSKNIRENPMTCRSFMSSLDDLTSAWKYQIPVPAVSKRCQNSVAAIKPRSSARLVGWFLKASNEHRQNQAGSVFKPAIFLYTEWTMWAGVACQPSPNTPTEHAKVLMATKGYQALPRAMTDMTRWAWTVSCKGSLWMSLAVQEGSAAGV